MKQRKLVPDAGNFVESLRDVGYTFNSAVADLIDNSISAKAKNVWIYGTYETDGAPLIAIIDDGDGMSPTRLFEAMAPASRDPRASVAPGDLGRFGLGLKTASFSQARRLTVVSRTTMGISAYCWDLDKVREAKDWLIFELSNKDIQRIPHIDKLPQVGTSVIWQGLDRISDGGKGTDEQAIFQSAISGLHDYLGLVFHRFLKKRKLNIKINETTVADIDPFLEDHKATSPLATEVKGKGQSKVTLTPFILPHPSKISYPTLKSRVSGASGYTHTQGFYVYRNERLTVWGTWFGLAKKDELSKLARVRVDISSAADVEWGIAIDKATANPSPLVLKHLKSVLPTVIGRSRRPFTHRTRTTKMDNPLWMRTLVDGRIIYSINLKHPLLEGVRKHLDPAKRKQLDASMKLLAGALPIPQIVSDFSGDESPDDEPDPDPGVFAEALRLMYDLCSAEQKTTFTSYVATVEPFAKYPQLVDTIVLEWSR